MTDNKLDRKRQANNLVHKLIVEQISCVSWFGRELFIALNDNIKEYIGINIC